MDGIRRKRTGQRAAATLFDDLRGNERDTFRDRVHAFAFEVAKRHRRDGGDLSALLVALEGWHRTWSICAPGRVPALDDEIVAAAVATYEERMGSRRRRAAA